MADVVLGRSEIADDLMDLIGDDAGHIHIPKVLSNFNQAMICVSIVSVECPFVAGDTVDHDDFGVFVFDLCSNPMRELVERQLVGTNLSDNDVSSVNLFTQRYADTLCTSQIAPRLLSVRSRV